MQLPGKNDQPHIVEQQLDIPKLRFKFGTVGFNFTTTPDGSETQLIVVWPHPMFPVEIEIPFGQLFYLERFIENLQTLHDKAQELQTPSA